MPDEQFVATSGATVRLRKLEVVANNLANASTIGYRADQTAFSATLESQIQFAAGPAKGANAMAFVDLGEISFDPSKGTIIPTGSPLDVAIQGDGWFEVIGEDGPRYTRAGSFLIGANRQLVTPGGQRVAGEGGPIELGDRPVSIVSSGEIVDDEGQTVGRLKVVEIDPRDLEKQGGNLFRLKEDGLARPLDTVDLAERSVEGSNVNTTRALAELMLIQRSYEASMQTMRAGDSATESLLREISQ